MKRILSLAIFSVLLAGCAATKPVSHDQRAKIKEIGVVSLVGDEFKFTKIGLTIFNNDEFIRNIDDGQFDKQIEQLIIKTIKNENPATHAATLAADRNVLHKLYRHKELGSYASLDRIKADLKALLINQPVDALILVHNEQVQDPIMGTSLNLYGSGLYYRSFPFVDPVVKPYTFLRIVVLDGKTMKVLGERAILGISKDYGKMQLSWDDELKNNLSDKQWAKFQADIKQLANENIVHALHEMGM